MGKVKKKIILENGSCDFPEFSPGLDIVTTSHWTGTMGGDPTRVPGGSRVSPIRRLSDDEYLFCFSEPTTVLCGDDETDRRQTGDDERILVKGDQLWDYIVPIRESKEVIREFIQEMLLYEYVVPMGFSLKQWRKYKKKNKVSNKKYADETKGDKWKIVHGHKKGKIGKPLKGATNLSYSKATKRHTAIALSEGTTEIFGEIIKSQNEADSLVENLSVEESWIPLTLSQIFRSVDTVKAKFPNVSEEFLQSQAFKFKKRANAMGIGWTTIGEKHLTPEIILTAWLEKAAASPQRYSSEQVDKGSSSSLMRYDLKPTDLSGYDVIGSETAMNIAPLGMRRGEKSYEDLVGDTMPPLHATNESATARSDQSGASSAQGVDPDITRYVNVLEDEIFEFLFTQENYDEFKTLEPGVELPSVLPTNIFDDFENINEVHIGLLATDAGTGDIEAAYVCDLQNRSISNLMLTLEIPRNYPSIDPRAFQDWLSAELADALSHEIQHSCETTEMLSQVCVSGEEKWESLENIELYYGCESEVRGHVAGILGRAQRTGQDPEDLLDYDVQTIMINAVKRGYTKEQMIPIIHRIYEKWDALLQIWLTREYIYKPSTQIY